MSRNIVAIICFVLLSSFSVSAYAQTEDDALLKQTTALQICIQKTLDDVEPSIASIIISRSDRYQRFGYPYSHYEPGRLGDFDAAKTTFHLKKLGISRSKREALIHQLDLENTDNVPESYGSGVVVGAEGLILTQFHVVRNATKIFVRLPNKVSGYADIHAADPRSDLAVIKLIKPAPKLRPIKIGKGEACKRGHFVLSMSNPFAVGFDDGKPSASWGIISNVRRKSPPRGKPVEEFDTLHQYGTLLQTDSRIQFGCSGGALLNLHGELVGVLTAHAASQGIDVPGGFAMPIDESTRKIIDILVRGEEVEYGFLGVTVGPSADNGRGVVLLNVSKGSPAEEGGLKAGHVITAIDGRPIQQRQDLFFALATKFSGTTITLGVIKNAKKGPEQLEIVLAKSYVSGPIIASKSRRPFIFGLRVDHTSLIVQKKFPGMQRDSIPKGVMISEVMPNSPAATKLLKPGEVITHLNSHPLSTPDDFYHLAKTTAGPLELTLISEPGQSAPTITLE